MSPDDKPTAETLRSKLGTMQAELEQVLRARTEAETSIEAHREKLATETTRLEEILKREGQLRGEVDDLTRAVKALDSR